MTYIPFRTLIFFVFIYPSYCVNNQIEGVVFTTLGHTETTLVFFIIPCALAAGLTALGGVVGMIEAVWMPMTMRIVHGLEITAGSIVHVWVLMALLVPRMKGSECEIPAITAG